MDGHGLAHPRRFGIACHLVMLLDLPTIGCAKSVLIDHRDPLGEELDSFTDLVQDGEVIGLALRTRRKTNPIFVSVGHQVDLPSAVMVIMACVRGYRLPEPARLAHHLATLKKTSPAT